MTMNILPGEVYPERELIERAIRGASSSHVSKVIMGKAIAEPRWKIVRDLFCCGSNMADRICVKYGFDPDDTVGPSAIELIGLPHRL